MASFDVIVSICEGNRRKDVTLSCEQRRKRRGLQGKEGYGQRWTSFMFIERFEP